MVELKEPVAAIAGMAGIADDADSADRMYVSVSVDLDLILLSNSSNFGAIRVYRPAPTINPVHYSFYKPVIVSCAQIRRRLGRRPCSARAFWELDGA